MRKEPGPRMPFGRFRGQLIKNVDTWYLKSAIQNDVPRVPAGWLRDTMEKELKKRGGEYVE